MQNKKHKERKEGDRITWSPFPSMPWKNLAFECTLEPAVKGKN